MWALLLCVSIRKSFQNSNWHSHWLFHYHSNQQNYNFSFTQCVQWDLYNRAPYIYLQGKRMQNHSHKIYLLEGRRGCPWIYIVKFDMGRASRCPLAGICSPCWRLVAPPSPARDNCNRNIDVMFTLCQYFSRVWCIVQIKKKSQSIW